MIIQDYFLQYEFRSLPEHNSKLYTIFFLLFSFFLLLMNIMHDLLYPKLGHFFELSVIDSFLIRSYILLIYFTNGHFLKNH